MKKMLIAACVLTVGVCAVPTAIAGGQTESEVTIDGADGSELGTIVYGNVLSSNRCRKGRTVELYNNPPGGPKVIHDTDLTSNRGAYALVLKKSDTVSSLEIRVLKSEAGSTTCGKDSEVIPF